MNTIKFEKVNYDDLHGRQQENYNYHKLSALLADYGFNAIRLDDDWQGADFIAQHLDGKTFLKVQLKGRLTFEKKYLGKELWLAFPENTQWYIFPHDLVLEKILPKIQNSKDWEKGKYSFPYLTDELKTILNSYKI
ncbi:MAG: hypothetical protein JNM24_06680 [Bdellovibrionaceae bacterium]|nr:hypothetical protein [Pseudobdellovibrionaceae bacterium]